MTEAPKTDRHKRKGLFVRLDDPALAALGRIREATGLGIAAAITFAITTTDRNAGGKKPARKT